MFITLFSSNYIVSNFLQEDEPEFVCQEIVTNSKAKPLFSALGLNLVKCTSYHMKHKGPTTPRNRRRASERSGKEYVVTQEAQNYSSGTNVKKNIIWRLFNKKIFISNKINKIVASM